MGQGGVGVMVGWGGDWSSTRLGRDYSTVMRFVFVFFLFCMLTPVNVLFNGFLAFTFIILFHSMYGILGYI